jgi:hypothetical protein
MFRIKREVVYRLLSDSLLYRSRPDRRIKGEIMYPTLDHMTAKDRDNDRSQGRAADSVTC